MHKSPSGSLGPGGLDLSQVFFKPIHNTAAPSPTKRHTKISVIGTGNVGMAIAQTILTQDLADELALVDAKADKLRGEMLDLQHAAAFLPRTKIQASTDYSVTVGSDLCIVTAGARQIPGESRLNLLQRNVNLFEKIIPPLAKPTLFEHGDSSVALWSSISVGGVPILTFLDKQQIAYEKETLENIHKAVVDSAYEVISLKGYTSWAIGYSAANLARSILRDQRKIHPVSVLAKGFYGIDGGMSS
ncbi:hypothetical protein GH714_009062 [Hevea brasiliensis]|uniref:Lactate/malate dehydrogenase N-terminal domain-containing protein n=1 Tax=Hevea brasiliensis TaxID=3981 RepID=A0A6A6MM47_HEVBR|nr:hypothetical protein GH714_009062 [Hevea brasiliensis]